MRTANSEQRTANSEQRTANSHNSALKILVCYYDSYGMPYTGDGIMLPIQAGKAIADYDLQIQGDDALNGQPCDNISSKNESYSELTALYWAWKNLRKMYPDVKYVGWSHYRRFFAFDESRFLTDIIKKPKSAIADYRVNAKKVIKILESGRIIAVKRNFLELPVCLQFMQNHNSADYRTLEKVIKEKFSDYYETFWKFMKRSNKISLYCMFIMKYEDFEKYCEWLFAVLAEVEPLVPYQCYNSYQKRIFAFMTERLFNVYILKNNLKPKYFNIYFYGDEAESSNIFMRMGRFVYHLLRLCKHELTFRLLDLKRKHE